MPCICFCKPVGADGKILNPESIGECLFAAIDDFNSQNPESTVVDIGVRMKKENSSCKPAILSALQSKVTSFLQLTSGHRSFISTGTLNHYIGRMVLYSPVCCLLIAYYNKPRPFYTHCISYVICQAHFHVIKLLHMVSCWHRNHQIKSCISFAKTLLKITRKIKC